MSTSLLHWGDHHLTPHSMSGLTSHQGTQSPPLTSSNTPQAAPLDLLAPRAPWQLMVKLVPNKTSRSFPTELLSSMVAPSMSWCPGLLLLQGQNFALALVEQNGLRVGSQQPAGMEQVLPKPATGNRDWRKVTRSKVTTTVPTGCDTWSRDQALPLPLHLPADVPTPSAK